MAQPRSAGAAPDTSTPPVDPVSDRPAAVRHVKAVLRYPGRFAVLVPGVLVGVSEVLVRLGPSPQLSTYAVHPAWRWWAAVLVLAGLTLLVWTNVLFHRAGGTLSPHDGPKRLVTAGPFRFLRHPMLLGVGLFLSGVAGLLGSWVLAGYAVAFLIGIAVYLKRVEQPKLRLTFPEYAEYERRVPFMWIPWRRRPGSGP